MALHAHAHATQPLGHPGHAPSPTSAGGRRDPASEISGSLAIRHQRGDGTPTARTSGRGSRSNSGSSDGSRKRSGSGHSAGPYSGTRRPGHHDYQERYTPQPIQRPRTRSTSREGGGRGRGRVQDIHDARRVAGGDRTIKRQPSSDTFVRDESNLPSYMRSTATSTRRQRSKSPSRYHAHQDVPGSDNRGDTSPRRRVRQAHNTSPFGVRRPETGRPVYQQAPGHHAPSPIHDTRRTTPAGAAPFAPSSPAPHTIRGRTGHPSTSPTTGQTTPPSSTTPVPAATTTAPTATRTTPRGRPLSRTPKTQPRMSGKNFASSPITSSIPPSTPRSERLVVHRTPNWRARRDRTPHKFEATDYPIDASPLPVGLRVSPGVVDSRLPAAKRSPSKSPVPSPANDQAWSPYEPEAPAKGVTPSPQPKEDVHVPAPRVSPVIAPRKASPQAASTPVATAPVPTSTSTDKHAGHGHTGQPLHPSPLHATHPAAVQQTPSPPTARAMRRGANDSPSSDFVARKETVEDLYEVGEEIGEGAFSHVFAGKTKATGTRVAIKRIDKVKWGDRMHFFRREVKVLNFIDHPSVVKLVDSFETDTELVLCMELVDGGSLLTKLLDEGRLNNVLARDMTKNLLVVLEHLHERDVMHRDLKPGNILIPQNDRAELKLCDFGHAAAVSDREAERHRTHVVSGTKEYWAPEVIMQQDTGCFDKSADVWALGVIVFIMLCGVFPFDGYTDAELFGDICNGAFTFPTDRPTSLDNDSMDFIRKCLIPDKRHRPRVSDLLRHHWITGVKAPTSTSTTPRHGNLYPMSRQPSSHGPPPSPQPQPVNRMPSGMRMASGTSFPQYGGAPGYGGGYGGGYPRYR